MLLMDMIAEIRRRHLVSRESISAIARDLKLSRPTVRKHCRTQTDPVYRRDKQPTPRLGAFEATLERWLRTERLLPKPRRRTARRLFEGLQAEGYRGAYDSVQRFVQRWKAAKSGPSLAHAFVPLAFAPSGPRPPGDPPCAASRMCPGCSATAVGAWHCASRAHVRPGKTSPRLER